MARSPEEVLSQLQQEEELQSFPESSSENVPSVSDLDVLSPSEIQRIIEARVNRDRNRQVELRGRIATKQNQGLALNPEESKQAELDVFFSPERPLDQILGDIELGKTPEGVTPEELNEEIRQRGLEAPGVGGAQIAEVGPTDFLVGGIAPGLAARGVGATRNLSIKQLGILGNALIEAGVGGGLPIVNAASDVITGERELTAELAKQTAIESAIGVGIGAAVGAGIGGVERVISRNVKEVIENETASAAKATARQVSGEVEKTSFPMKSAGKDKTNVITEQDKAGYAAPQMIADEQTPRLEVPEDETIDRGIDRLIANQSNPAGVDEQDVIALRKVKNVVKSSRERIKTERRATRKKGRKALLSSFTRGVVDPSFNVKKTLDQQGELGEQVVHLQNAALRSDSVAGLDIDTVNAQAYKGLNRKAYDEFTEYAVAQQVITRNKLRPGIKSSGDMTLEDAQRVVKVYDNDKNLANTGRTYNVAQSDPTTGQLLRDSNGNIVRQVEPVTEFQYRWHAQSDGVRRLVEDGHKAGLYDRQFANFLQDQDYMETRFIDPITNKETKGTIVDFLDPVVTTEAKGPGQHPINIRESGVRQLDQGSTGDIVVDPRRLFEEFAISQRARIARNKANTGLHDLAVSQNGDGIITTRALEFDKMFTEVGLTRNADGLIQGLENLPDPLLARVNKALEEATPDEVDNIIEDTVTDIVNKEVDKVLADTTVVSFLDAGKPVDMFMDKDLADEWILRDPWINSSVLNFVSTISGSSAIKTFAVGSNPEFAIPNLVRDIPSAIINTEEFSAVLPIAVLQLNKQISATASDSINKTGLWKEMIENGGLATGFTDLARETSSFRNMGKSAQEFFGAVSDISERLVRTGVYKQALDNGRSKTEAAYIAAQYIDFSVNAPLTKAADSLFPFASATVAGLRATLKQATKGPKQAARFAFYMGQAMTMGAGFYMAGRWAWNDIYKQVPKEQRINNYIIPAPFKIQKNGTWEDSFWKIPKDPISKPVVNAMEFMLDAMFFNEAPSRLEFADVAKSFNPFNLSIPVYSAYQAVFKNYDDYLESDIWKGADVDNHLKVYGSTNQLFIDIANSLGMAPVQVERGAQKLLANNMFTNLSFDMYDLLRDNPDKNGVTNVDKALDRMPVITRFLDTVPKVSDAERSIIDLSKKDLNSRKLVQNRQVEQFAKGIVAGEVGTEEVVKWIGSQPSIDRKRVEQRFMVDLVLERTGASIPEKDFLFAVKRLAPEARANAFFEKVRTSVKVTQKDLFVGLMTHDAIAGSVKGLNRMATDDFVKVLTERIVEHNKKNPRDQIRFDQ